MDLTPLPDSSSDSSDELSIRNILRASDRSTGGTVPAERVARALTEVVRENLAPTVAVLAVLWLLLALQGMFVVERRMDRGTALLLVGFAIASAVLSVALTRIRLPTEWVRPSSFVLMLMGVTVGTMVLQRHPDVRTALPLLGMLPVAGAILLDRLHFASLSALAVAAWTTLAWARFDDDDLGFFVSFLSLALVVSIYVHVTRRHTFRRVAQFRLRERARSHRLRREVELAYRSQAELAELSIRDPLTGAYNRRYLAQLKEELERPTARWGAVMIDLDDFKAVNDRYGHEEGDRVLQAHAHFLRRASRAEDRLVRYGGDEFLLIVEVRSQDELDDVVRRLVASADTEAPGAFTLGAAFRRAREPLQETIARADEAMYVRRGRPRSRRRRGRA